VSGKINFLTWIDLDRITRGMTSPELEGDVRTRIREFLALVRVTARCARFTVAEGVRAYFSNVETEDFIRFALQAIEALLSALPTEPVEQFLESKGFFRR